MDRQKDLELILEELKAFHGLISKVFHVQKLFLYASAAGIYDIDVGVVLKPIPQKSRDHITAELSRYAQHIDQNIKPHCIFSQEYEAHNYASSLGKIIRTAIPVLI